MVTPNRRRQAVVLLTDEFGVSQRRACRVVGQHRSTQRLAAPVPDDEQVRIRAWLRAFAKRRPRWGWRRAAAQLRREGWMLNHKRVRRLWRDEGLQVPQKRRRGRLVGIGSHVGAMCPICPDALWACDFQFDRTIGGRQVKLLNIIDEYTREALSITVAHAIGADDVVAVLDRLVAQRGQPLAFIRFDIHIQWWLELVAHAVVDWAHSHDTPRCSSIPGRPGRMPGSSRSTVGSATSCSTAGSSTRCSKPKS
jgi:putative transposase